MNLYYAFPLFGWHVAVVGIVAATRLYITRATDCKQSTPTLRLQLESTPTDLALRMAQLPVHTQTGQ